MASEIFFLELAKEIRTYFSPLMEKAVPSITTTLAFSTSCFTKSGNSMFGQRRFQSRNMFSFLNLEIVQGEKIDLENCMSKYRDEFRGVFDCHLMFLENVIL